MTSCLIIHGYTGSPHEVKPLTDYLRAYTDWNISVPTLPGHGDKSQYLGDVTYNNWLEAAEDALTQQLAADDTNYLIGFSMGGMIAGYLASKYSIDKLVLLAPSGKYLVFKQIFKDIKDIANDGLKGNIRDSHLYMQYKQTLEAVPFKANLEFLKLVKFTRRYLSKITSPVLIAHGLQDMIVPYSTSYYMDKKIPSEQKEIVIFEQSGHMICLGDDRDILNKIVYTFLTK